MMTRDYLEGVEARRNFEDMMTRLFRVPKLAKEKAKA